MKNNTGLIHIYTGEGKGKTTASLGLAVRAAGRDLKVVIVQFLKGRDTGEMNSLCKIPEITVYRNEKDYGFFFAASDDTKVKIRTSHDVNLKKAIEMIENQSCDLLILDEILAAYSLDAVSREIVDELVMNKPDGLELVLTGRDAPDKFLERADYVSEVVKRKHPYEQGINARKGIEY